MGAHLAEMMIIASQYRSGAKESHAPLFVEHLLRFFEASANNATTLNEVLTSLVWLASPYYQSTC